MGNLVTGRSYCAIAAPGQGKWLPGCNAAVIAVRKGDGAHCYGSEESCADGKE